MLWNNLKLPSIPKPLFASQTLHPFNISITNCTSCSQFNSGDFQGCCYSACAGPGPNYFHVGWLAIYFYGLFASSWKLLAHTRPKWPIKRIENEQHTRTPTPPSLSLVQRRVCVINFDWVALHCSLAERIPGKVTSDRDCWPKLWSLRSNRFHWIQQPAQKSQYATTFASQKPENFGHKHDHGGAANKATLEEKKARKRNNKNVCHLPLVALMAATGRIRNMQLTRPFPLGYASVLSLPQAQAQAHRCKVKICCQLMLIIFIFVHFWGL